MSALIPLPSNASHTATLFLDTAAPLEALLMDATRRVETVRDMAATLSALNDNTQGLSARDLAAFGLAVEILTSDAAAILGAMEIALLRAKKP